MRPFRVGFQKNPLFIKGLLAPRLHQIPKKIWPAHNSPKDCAVRNAEVRCRPLLRYIVGPDGGEIANAQDNDRSCWPSSAGHCVTNLGCECDHFDRSRAPRFACSNRGLLVRMVGRLNGSTQRGSILPMLLWPRERP